LQYPFYFGRLLFMSELHLADDLSLPVDAVTQTFAILAMRGAGKTNTAVVMAEEMAQARLPFVVIDPVGVWWGLRFLTNGEPSPWNLVILGGSHADIPIDQTQGETVADLIVEGGLSFILDISGFESENAKKKFLLDFARRLYLKNTQPLHLFLEEADDYIPQRPMRDEAQLLRAWENIVRRGRSRGLGCTLITQRSAAINKNVLTQIETLIVMRTTSPQDRVAISEWVKYHDQSQELLMGLSSLPTGVAWVWSPQWLGSMQQHQVRRRESFDSSATPKIGEQAFRPVFHEPADLERLRARLVKPEPSSPSRGGEHVRVEKVIERVEILILTDYDRTILQALGEWVESLNQWTEQVRPILDKIFAEASSAFRIPVATERGNGSTERLLPKPGSGQSGVGTTLSKGQRAILTVLAQHGECSRIQVAILSRYSHTSGGFANTLSQLRSAGLIEKGDPIRITQVGLAALGSYESLPVGQELVEWWYRNLPRAERTILSVLVGVYPKGLSREETAAQAGYTSTSGGYANALSRLRTLGLIRGSRELEANSLLFRTGVL
jgi:hypothetical protein